MNEIIGFGNWLRRRRKALDLTQEQLAARVGCSPDTIRKIEAGTRRPSREMVEALSRPLAVPPEERRALVEFARLGTGSNATESAPEYRKEPQPTGLTPDLPRPLTTFVGRHKQMEAVRSMLWRTDVRLLTLTGAGGSGKTRLAIQVAHGVSQDFQNGAVFVSLATITDPFPIIPAIARRLGVPETPGKPLMEGLNDYLRNKHMLLVLDNFEQVLQAAPLVAELLSGAPKLKILATSREPLHLYGEHQFPVPPLQLPEKLPERPESTNLLSAEALHTLYECEATDLFVQRARLVKPDFTVTDVNAQAVAEICARLDGLPLAIELATARVNMVPPQEMLSRMEDRDRLSLLTRGPKDVPIRQQTLRNTIEWSYGLLNKGEKELFYRLAVFAGGATLQSIAAVCNIEHDLEVDILDGVTALMDKSLLKQESRSAGEPRFAMLETIREYAREKLVESREEATLCTEHVLYFMRLAEEAEPHLYGPRQQEWLNRLEDEHENIHQALKWAQRTSDKAEKAKLEKSEAADKGPDVRIATQAEADLGLEEAELRLAAAVWRYWGIRGYISEGREALEAILSRGGGTQSKDTSGSILPDISTSGTKPSILRWARARARALHGAGWLAMAYGNNAIATSRLEQSVAAYRAVGDRRGMAYVLNNLGEVVRGSGLQSKARELSEEALAIFRELGDTRGVAETLCCLAFLATEQGNPATAYPMFEESLALLRASGDKRSISLALGGLGYAATVEGDYSAALRFQEESLALVRELGDKISTSVRLASLGITNMQEGKYAVARSLFEESLAMLRQLGSDSGVADVLCNLGHAALLERDYPSARSLYEESLNISRKLGLTDLVMQCLGGLGAVIAGEGMEVEQADKGARLLGASEALREARGVLWLKDDRMVYDHGVTSARSQLGQEAFEKARQAGRGMSMEEAIDYALEQNAR